MKKLLLITLALLLVATSALAAATPSITKQDMFKVVMTTPDGKPLPATLSITLDPESETALAVLESIKKLAQGQPSLADAVFGEQADAIKEALKTDKLEKVKLHELASLIISGYTEDMGSIQSSFAFPTQFVPDQPLVGMLGMVDGEAIAWEALPGMSNAAGGVVLTLSPEVMLKVQDGNAVLAIIK